MAWISVLSKWREGEKGLGEPGEAAGALMGYLPWRTEVRGRVS